jgi:hypothetical protein
LLQFAKDRFGDELFLGSHKSEVANSSEADGAKSSELG